MKALLIGSHPAMDFFNTTMSPGGTPIELIGDGQAFVEWLVDAGLLDAPNAAKVKRRFGSEPLDAVAAEARRFREWAGDWVFRWHHAPEADYGTEVRRLNRLLEREHRYDEIVVADGVQTVERWHLDSPDALIGLVARQVALLITTERPELVKRCAGPECTLAFLDRTKARRRIYCSATGCGNRAKVAAFRERQRQQ
ncbi:MAG TPA: CGNR zinc finger domain-containing protein [Gemmatimonadaceae bacterium]|jgi:predicted RNA-binding Zn ribbon-like protein|nr:CGNR zinc finger domain-containing protein [Gemmatimonadaceae bacterium]